MPLFFILIIAFSAWAGVSETGLLSSRPISDQAYGTPRFTDPDAYNEYDAFGSPLGIFEKESSSVHLELGWNMLSLVNAKTADSGSESSNVPVIPELTVGKRDILYLMFDYEPAWLERTSAGQTLSLAPLHRFGVTVAAETPAKYMRFGIVATGYTGTLTTSAGQDSRTVMGLTRLSAYLGSQVHPLVRIGIHGGATGNLDSLRDLTNTFEDRFFYGTIPSYGGDVNIGTEGVPVQSNFNLDIASNHFVYVTKGMAPQKPDGNEDALVGDSVSWQWNTIGKIGYAGFTYQPALSMEYWRNKIQDYAPGPKNYPLQYGPARGDTNWAFSSFTLGIGASSLLQTYGKAWFEYGHEFFWASFGAGANTPGKSRGYDYIGLGLEGNVNAVPGLRIPKSVEAFCRLGYDNMRLNSRWGQYHGDEFRQFTPVEARSQFSNDNGEYSLAFGSDQRVSRFSLGAGGTFFNRMLGADFTLAFLSGQESGFEFGVGVEFMLKGKKE
ncbi:MAG TPA: hypothetical protein VLX68_12175 [Chitinivibrionales bacterium]|nr:hypothetical protein [Chitinivibrionales bacterium]